MNIAQLDEMNLDDASAVVLVRRLTPGSRVCQESADWVLELPEMTQIFFAPRPTDEELRPEVA